jgi:hypothetical protein
VSVGNGSARPGLPALQGDRIGGMIVTEFDPGGQVVAKHGKPIEAPRRVWRMTPSAPQGEIVDSTLPAVAPKAVEKAAEKPAGSETVDPHWRASSFDLLHGLEVSDEADTIPGELFDELFKQK